MVDGFWAEPCYYLVWGFWLLGLGRMLFVLYAWVEYRRAQALLARNLKVEGTRWRMVLGGRTLAFGPGPGVILPSCVDFGAASHARYACDE